MSLPSGIVTFLFTDIEGSTRLWEQQAEAMNAAVARHNSLAEAVIAAHGGVLVKSRGEGDSLFAVFVLATAAVAGACALQQAFLDEIWPDGIRMRVRMALHTGEADRTDGDYFGSAVNRCARLRGIAHGGQILLSVTTAELVRDSLAVQMSLEDLGEQPLRDMARPEHVFQLRHPRLPGDFPALRTLRSLPNNLPRQLTTFIGREIEIAEVESLLQSTALLTLTGAGGCGKTRLAIQAAADLLDSFPDGVWLIEFGSLSEPTRVPQAVAAVLGVREEAGRALLQRLVDVLRPKTLLLLLDNCEHLLAACAGLIDVLLRACPRLKIMATSREGLGITGETLYYVPSLSLPDPNRLPRHSEELPAFVSQFEAVRLFADRAVAAATTFTVTPQNATAIAQVCHRLDGIPLAIELAAARVKSLPVAQIAVRLNDRFRLLTEGSRTALPRQQTLRALIDWSYDLLSPHERELFHRLSVFAGGFTLEAAEAVCADPPASVEPESIGDAPVFVGADDVLGLLTHLVDRSLVAAESGEGRVRYRLLETLRQYGREKLAASGHLARVENSRLAYFLAVAEEADKKLRGSEQAWWLELLEQEHDNLRAALYWCLGGACVDQGDVGDHTLFSAENRAADFGDPPADEPSMQRGSAETGLRLAALLWWFWHVRGYFTEGREWLAAGLNRAPQNTSARARALNGAAVLARNQGDYAAAQALSEQSLAMKRELGDRQGVAAALNTLATLALQRSDYAAAKPFYQESLQIERSMGSRQGVTASLIGLANVALEQGDYGAARRLYLESLTIKRDLRDKRGIATSLAGLGAVAFCLADFPAARISLQESLDIRRELGDRRGIANCLEVLGSLAVYQESHEEAEELLAESLALHRELGDKMGVARSLYAQATQARRRGEPSAELYLTTLLAFQELENRRGIADAIRSLGLLAASALPQSAVTLLCAADALDERLGCPLAPCDRAECLLQFGIMRAALGDSAFEQSCRESATLSLDQVIQKARETASLLASMPPELSFAVQIPGAERADGVPPGALLARNTPRRSA